MSIRDTIVLSAVFFFIEPTVAGLIAPRGKAPDLLLCLTIIGVFLCREAGPVIGITVVTAVLQDICFSLYAGPGAAALFLAGIFAAAAVKYCVWDRLAFYLAFTALDTILYEFVLWAGMKLSGVSYSFLYLLELLPLAVVYNLTLIALVYYKYLKQKKGAEEI